MAVCPINLRECEPEHCAMTVQTNQFGTKTCAIISIAYSLHHLSDLVEGLPNELERRGAF